MTFMYRLRFVILVLLSMLIHSSAWTQNFVFFDPSVKEAYPSVVYDFLERYLYEMDSLLKAGEPILQRMIDDKVSVVEGNIMSVSKLTPQTGFNILAYDDKYYQATWFDSSGNTILCVVFPMQYELLLGKPKVQIEREMYNYLASIGTYHPKDIPTDKLMPVDSNCWTTIPIQHYYVEDLNNACFFIRDDSVETFRPVFDTNDKWHSLANLFQGVIDSVENYTLYVEQNIYGFKKDCYSVRLSQWLEYCKSMKLDVYFAIEEERTDGLSALLIAHSKDLGFNHMMYMIVPDNFVEKPTSVIKVTLNAFIPTQNIKDLYQQFVKKPKKKI